MTGKTMPRTRDDRGPRTWGDALRLRTRRSRYVLAVLGAGILLWVLWWTEVFT